MATLSLSPASPIATNDYHLAAGYVSPRLNQIIIVTLIKNNASLVARGDNAGVAANGVTLSFKSMFSSQPPANQPISIDPNTGEFAVPNVLPALTSGTWPQEVIVQCHASMTTGEHADLFFRFWIHKELYRVWLTPAQFTVRQNAKNVRLSLLCKFTDGVFADLSNWSPYSPPQTNADANFVRYRVQGFPATGSQPVVVWSASGTGLTLDTKTGMLNCTSVTASATVSVSIQTFSSPAIPTLDAAVLGAPRWSTPTEVRPLRERIDKFSAMNTKRNILFLPDGFVGDDGKTEFRNIAVELVHRLTTLPETSPYLLVQERLNFFYAWVDSPQSDISVLNALSRLPYSGPTHSPPGVACDANERMQPSAIHFIANEQSTAFHCAIGRRPGSDAGNLWPNFHRLRVDWDDFNEFINALYASPTVQEVPAKWARLGDDRQLIVILCRTRRGDGLNQLTSLPQDDQRAVFLPIEANDTGFYVDNGKSYDVLAAGPPTTADFVIGWGVLAHELSHSFYLDDEYSTHDRSPLADLERGYIDGSPNTQRFETLIDSNKHIVSSKIKWNWTRIRKACDYQTLVQPNPAVKQFKCTLNDAYRSLKDKRDRFGKGDIVWLRKRDLVTSGDQFAGPFKIDEKVTGLEVKLSFQYPGGTMPSAFFDPSSTTPAPPGLLLMREKVGAFDVNLIDGLIEAHIGADGNPTNASAGESPHAACTTGSSPTPTAATNVPAGLTLPAQSFKVVGLFESGHRRDCGVYHPTGACIMNEVSYTDTTGRHIRPFCHVCRYALVDKLDPRMHGRIDREYAKVYPK